jgi:hypothetical protein
MNFVFANRHLGTQKMHFRSWQDMVTENRSFGTPCDNIVWTSEPIESFIDAAGNPLWRTAALSAAFDAEDLFVVCIGDVPAGTSLVQPPSDVTSQGLRFIASLLPDIDIMWAALLGPSVFPLSEDPFPIPLSQATIDAMDIPRRAVCLRPCWRGLDHAIAFCGISHAASLFSSDLGVGDIAWQCTIYKSCIVQEVARRFQQPTSAFWPAECMKNRSINELDRVIARGAIGHTVQAMTIYPFGVPYEVLSLLYSRTVFRKRLPSHALMGPRRGSGAPINVIRPERDGFKEAERYCMLPQAPTQWYVAQGSRFYTVPAEAWALVRVIMGTDSVVPRPQAIYRVPTTEEEVFTEEGEQFYVAHSEDADGKTVITEMFGGGAVGCGRTIRL